MCTCVRVRLCGTLYNCRRFSIHSTRMTLYSVTLVIPNAPMFSLYDVVPFPVPHIPAKRHPNPSTAIPASQANRMRLLEIDTFCTCEQFMEMKQLFSVYLCTYQ